MEHSGLKPVLSEELAARWVRAQPILTAYLMSLVRDLSIAEDIAQEVAVAATRQYTAEQHERPFMPWIYGIARNQVALHLRQKYKNPVVFNSEVVDVIESAFDRISPEVSDRRSALSECVKDLSPRSRRLIELRYDQGIKPQQIALKLGTTANTISVSLSRIRVALGDCINRRIAGGVKR